VWAARISEEIAIIFEYSIRYLFTTETERVYCAVRAVSKYDTCRIPSSERQGTEGNSKKKINSRYPITRTRSERDPCGIWKHTVYRSVPSFSPFCLDAPSTRHKHVSTRTSLTNMEGRQLNNAHMSHWDNTVNNVHQCTIHLDLNYASRDSAELGHSLEMKISCFPAATICFLLRPPSLAIAELSHFLFCHHYIHI
jgi:hypothetical protein